MSVGAAAFRQRNGTEVRSTEPYLPTLGEVWSPGPAFGPARGQAPAGMGATRNSLAASVPIPAWRVLSQGGKIIDQAPSYMTDLSFEPRARAAPLIVTTLSATGRARPKT